MRDIDEAAHSAVQTVIDRTEPPRKASLPHVAVGRLGALKGGRARAAALTPERRREIAPGRRAEAVDGAQGKDTTAQDE